MRCIVYRKALLLSPLNSDNKKSELCIGLLYMYRYVLFPKSKYESVHHAFSSCRFHLLMHNVCRLAP